MKKIGILTFHDALNYGAVLQAYALSKALQKIATNCEVEVINYKCKYISDSSKFIKLLSARPFPKGIILAASRYKTIKGFNTFKSQFLPLSASIDSYDELKEAFKKYDLIITGSDQVWNSSWTKDDITYTLDSDFYSGLKYSYAASFGNDVDFKIKDAEIKKRLPQFKVISVREKDAELAVIDNLHLPCRRDVDPTMLLDINDWKNIEINHKTNKQYLFLYMVPYDEEVFKIAKQIAKEKKMDLKIGSRTFKHLESKHVGSASPGEFLGFIKDANYVVTNSFHGTAFSVIYHKQAQIILKNPRGYNVRSKDLLADLGVISSDYREEKVTLDNLNWEEIERKKLAMRSGSIDYLSSIIDGLNKL